MRKPKENFEIHFTKTTEAFLKVIYWFFAYPNRQIGLNDLSEETKVSKTTAKRIVESLVKENFLNREIIGKIWRISCNQKHVYNRTIKISYNLSLIYESGIIDQIHEKFGYTKVIILFGSYRKGDDNECSDIDIAIEISGDQKFRMEKLINLSRLGYRINVPVNLHIFSRKNIDKNLFANIANGIVLDGFLEVKP